MTPGRDPSDVVSPPGRELHLALGAALVFAVAAFALLHATVIGDQVLSAASSLVVRGPFEDAQREGLRDDGLRFADTFRCFEPWLRDAADGWAERGELPLWRDRSMLGAPFLANSQSALLFPPRLLAVLAGAPPSALGWLALVKLVTGSLGAWLLARHLRCGLVGALIAGFSFGFYGFGVAFLLWPQSNVSTLLPWLVWLSLRAAGRPTGGGLAALAAVAGLQHLGGHPETAMLCQVTAFALGAAACPGPWRAALGRTLTLASAFVLGALLAAPQLLPFVEYLALSDALAWRSEAHAAAPPTEWAPTVAMLGALLVAAWTARRLMDPRSRPLPWAAALTAALVVAARYGFGLKCDLDPASVLAADWLGDPARSRSPSNYIEDASAYAGPAFALALAAPLVCGRRPAARRWLVVLAVAWLLRARLPGLHDLVEAVPVVGLMPAQRAGLVMQLAVAVLAGMACDELGRATLVRHMRGRLLALLAVLPLVAAGSLLWITADGLIGMGGVTGPPAGMPRLTDVTLAPAGTLADGPAVYHGTFHAPGTVESVDVWWSRRELASPATFLRQHAPASDGSGRYSLSVTLPGDQRASATAMLRLEVTLDDGRRFTSRALVPEAGLLTLAASVPVLPRDGHAPLQLLLFAATGALAALRVGRPGRGAVCLLVPTVAGLAAFTVHQLPTTPRDAYFPTSPAIEHMRETVGRDARLVTARNPWIAEPLSAYGIPQVMGYDAVVPAHSARLIRAAVAPGQTGRSYVAMAASAEGDTRLLALLAVRQSYGSLPGFQLDRYEGYEQGQRLELFDALDVLPRARLVGAARVVPDDDATLALLQDPHFDVAGELILADGEPLTADGQAPLGSVEILLAEPDRVLVSVDPARPAYLLLADSWFPGWKALVDGRERPVRRADLALRAVAVGPGDAEVEFVYRPGSWRLGLALSALAAAICAAMVVTTAARSSAASR